MLTGESVPKVKVSMASSIASDPSAKTTPLRINSSGRYEYAKNVVFGGTEIVAHHQEAASSDVKAPKPPNGGCIGYVLRTGFYTGQGELMRTLLHSNESAATAADQRELFIFISILVCLAVCASGYVLHEGLRDERRAHAGSYFSTAQ